MKTNKILIAKIQEDLACEEWISVIEIYQPLISNWVVRFGGAASDVADMTQDVLCIVIRELPKFTHNGRTGAFRNWLKTITVNRLRRHWKRRSRERQLDGELNEQALQQLADPNSQLSILWNHEHDKHVFEQVLARVSTEYDELTMASFRKFVLEGQDSRVVAGELGVSVAQIYKYKFRIMKRLRALIQQLSHGTRFDTLVGSVVDEFSRSAEASGFRESA